MSASNAEAFLDKVAADEPLRNRLAASDAAAWVAEGVSVGLEFSEDELGDALQRRTEPLPLSEESLDAVAGGAGAVLSRSVRDLGSYPTYGYGTIDRDLGTKTNR